MSDSVLGPWRRPDRPFLEPRGEGYWDAIATTNPAPVIHEDGTLVLMFKSRSCFQGARLLGMAHFGADWTQPTYRSNSPLFEGQDLEDPFLWRQDGIYYCLMKDMTGRIGGEPGAGVIASSTDAIDWKFEDNPLAYSKILRWDVGSPLHLHNLERPQLLIENGSPQFLFAATATGEVFHARDAQTSNMAFRIHPSS